MTYAGNYLAGAFDHGSLVGACSRPDPVTDEEKW